MSAPFSLPILAKENLLHSSLGSFPIKTKTVWKQNNLKLKFGSVVKRESVCHLFMSGTDVYKYSGKRERERA